MSSYVNLILDTIGPSGVSVVINNGETKTTSTAVTLAIGCGDADLTGYQMKIWGVAGAETEDSAPWETYQSSKTVTLPTRDGTKTVYVKVRDDVWNESTAVSDNINLYTTAPTVDEFVLTSSKISLVDQKNHSGGSFHFNEPIDAVKIMIVDNINATHNAAGNLSIPVTNGSYLYDEYNEDVYPCTKLEYEYAFDSNMRYLEFDVNAADILSVSPGDGVKIIKAFVRSAVSGNWSV